MPKNNSEGYNLTILAMQIMAKQDGAIKRYELRRPLREKAIKLGIISKERSHEKDNHNRLLWMNQLDSYSGANHREHIDKNKSGWSLTEAGRQFIKKTQFDKPQNSEQHTDSYDVAVDENPPITEEQGEEIIADYIKQVSERKNTGKKLERIVAALLRGMGYSHVEVCGGAGDGGIDVIAYKDKLGAIPPRIKAQVKHITTGHVGEEVIQKLVGTIHDGEIGICVTTSSFTKDAKKLARNNSNHLLLIDIDRLVELWIEYYPHMTEEDKRLVPLVYTLDISKANDGDASTA